ncbi:hypothetical protein D3C71_644990 [compost metagenome]
MVCGRLETSSPLVPLQKGETKSQLRARIPISKLTLNTEKKIAQTQCERESSIEGKEKSILLA